MRKGGSELRMFWRSWAFAVLFFMSAGALHAGPRESYEQATMQYISAIVSMATYNDRAGRIARRELADAGWHIEAYNERFHGADAKFFVVENHVYKPGQEIYIVAITGTETASDVLIDLNFDKVYFGGHTPGGFIEAAKKRGLVSADPMVHHGFNKYAQAAFFTSEKDDETYGEYLVELLAASPERKLYLVGHSLGGAVATIGAARLVNMGADPKQIEVITFGAPAVGNRAFAEIYGKRLELNRVVIKGDPVKNTLQRIAGGYAQFGEQTEWEENRNVDKMSHSMVVYVDSAVRNFFDKQGDLIAAGLEDERLKDRKAGEKMAYIAPMTTAIDAEFQTDEAYIRASAKSALQMQLSGFVFGAGERESLARELDKARAAGCEYLITQDVEIKKVRTMQNVFYVSYQEDIYAAADGRLLATLHHANGTRDFTPILANLHNVTNVNEERDDAMEALP